VHVVGEEVYAVRIDTEAIDYRYARAQVGTDAQLLPYDLAAEVAEPWIALPADLDLGFAGIDLKLAPDGRVVCFEVNPSPRFSWFEAENGLPIAAALARWRTRR
jgi:glutathione synthase/RimK-type ligase-like ATP-grasp enzyme